MWLQIQSETRDETFSIEYRNGPDVEYTDAILYKKDGAWHFIPHERSTSSWLCNGNIEWPEALKRALVHIDMMWK